MYFILLIVFLIIQDTSEKCLKTQQKGGITRIILPERGLTLNITFKPEVFNVQKQIILYLKTNEEPQNTFGIKVEPNGIYTRGKGSFITANNTKKKFIKRKFDAISNVAITCEYISKRRVCIYFNFFDNTYYGRMVGPYYDVVELGAGINKNDFCAKAPQLRSNHSLYI